MGDTDRHSKTGRGSMHKLATNDPKTMEYEIIGADGSIIWGELALDV